MAERARGGDASGGLGICVARPLLPTARAIAPYLREVDRTRIYSNWGPLVLTLQERLERCFSLSRGAVTCAASGTAALVGAILAAAGRAKPGRDIAIVPSFTFAGTAAAAEACGFKIVLADIDPQTWSLTPAAAKSAFDLDRVGLVVPAAPFGRPIRQEPWKTFAKETGIPVVIDAAACFDTARRPAEYIGSVPVAFSLHATKSFGVGEGGLVLCTDLQLSQRVVRALNFGFYARREVEAYGSNGKISEYHAAVGLAELDRWQWKINRYGKVAETYLACFVDARAPGGLVLSPSISVCYALYQAETPRDAGLVAARFEQEGIGCRFWYGEGLHRHRVYRDERSAGLPDTRRIARTLLGIPMAVDLTAWDMRRIATAIARATAAGKTRASAVSAPDAGGEYRPLSAVART